MLEADVAADRGRAPRIGSVDHLRLLVEDRGDPVERGGRREERVVELRQLLNRVEEVREIEREREQRSDGQLAVDDEPPPKPRTIAVATEERTSTAGK